MHMFRESSMMKRYKSFLFAVATLLGLSACSGGSSSDSVKVGLGTYIDDSVEGLEYICGDERGITDSEGLFRYEIGRECLFRVGAVSVRSIEASKLTKERTVIQETDIKVAQFLLTLDETPDDTKIQISKILKKELESVTPQRLEDSNLTLLFEELVNSLREKGLNTEGVTVVDEESAKEHILQSFQSYCADENFVVVEEQEYLDICKKSGDTTPPLIVLYGGSQLRIFLNAPFNDPGVKAVDDIDGDLSVTVTGSVDTTKLGRYTLKYSAVDLAGNISTATRVVEVLPLIDTIAPEMSLVGSSRVTVELNGEYRELGAVAIDNVDGNITNRVISQGNVETSTLGNYSIVYSVSDSSNNRAQVSREIVVVDAQTADTVAPEIKLSGSNPLYILKGSSYSEAGYSAYDDRDGDITSSVTLSGSIDTDNEGAYTLSYSVSDKAGNSTTAQRVVNVVASLDSEPPLITLKGDNPLIITQGSSFVDPGASAVDARDGIVTLSTVVRVDTNSVSDSYSVTYRAVDKAGNEAITIRSVSVIEAADTTAPIIKLNGDSYMSITLGETFVDPGATAVDDRDGTLSVSVSGSVDSSVEGSYTLLYSATDTAGNRATLTRVVEVKKDLVSDPDSYIPKDSNLTDAMAVKFLNMATFGATPNLVRDLRSKGVVKWVDEQLAMEYSVEDESILHKLINFCLKVDWIRYSDDETLTIDDYLSEENDIFFNQGRRNGLDEVAIHYSFLFDQNLQAKDQLRQRVAYALSQIIIASQSNDEFFTDRGEALSYYYDLLLQHAFGNYGELLYDISLSPTMATFLTYASNEKEYVDPETNATILPDENYGREIMQLFSIGLYELNINGTEKRVDGVRVPTYTQSDVNEMSKVFTGMYYAHSNWGDSILKGDTTHPLSCDENYHDMGQKSILGETIPAGQSCQADVRSAVNLLMKHSNVAPFISKKLILRLTKSNPTTAYIQRVAEVFEKSEGDLKATIRAVLLDEEIWENIKEDRGVKIKEPYIDFTQVVRAVDFQPLPWKEFQKASDSSEYVKVENPGFLTESLYGYLGENPTESPSVFNFYSDTFEPDDDEFKIRGFVAPELEIITAKYAVNYNNFLSTLLEDCSTQKRLYSDESATPDAAPNLYRADRTYMYVDYKEAVDIAKNNGFGVELDSGNDEETKEKIATLLIDYYSQRLLGRKLTEDKRNAMIAHHKDDYWRLRSDTTPLADMEFILERYWIVPIILDITHTDEYMVN